MVFREGPIDGASARLFATHVGIAIDALDRIEVLTRRVSTLDGGVGQDTMDHWAYEWSKNWQDAWDQLGEARAIAARVGRDVSRYDEARAAAGDIYVDVASGRALTVARVTHMTWQNRSTLPAKRAIAAFRSAMPKVIIVAPDTPRVVEVPSEEVTEIPPEKDTPRWITAIVLVILGVVIYFAATQ